LIKHYASPVARAIPFDNSTNGFVSTESQAAIEEARNEGQDASRGPTICSFDGNAATGRWLEFAANNPSNDNPYVVAEPGQIRALSISASANSTGTVQIKKNGTNITSISLSASRYASVTGLSLSLANLDLISSQVSSGSITRPTVFIFIQTY
jgi:hypothetical protein